MHFYTIYIIENAIHHFALNYILMSIEKLLMLFKYNFVFVCLFSMLDKH